MAGNLIIRNVAAPAADVAIDDLGITVYTASPDRDLHDFEFHHIADSYNNGDLGAAIAADDIVLLDTDGSTPLTKAQTQAILDELFSVNLPRTLRTIVGDTGSFTVDEPNDSFTLTGTSGLSVNIAGGTITLDATGITGAQDDIASVQLGTTIDLDLNINVYTTMAWDTTNFENFPSIISHDPVTNNSRITVSQTGAYLVWFAVTVQPTANTDEFRFRVIKNGVLTALPGSERSMVEDDEANDCGNVFPVTLDAGDYIEFQVWVDDEPTHMDALSHFGAMRLRGSKGDQGIPGSGSSVTIQDEGIPVTGTPHTTLNFVGTNVTATNAGGGVATISVTGIVDTFATIQVDGVAQSTNAPTLDFDSSDFTLVESPTDDFDITINNSGIDHDQTTNFVANEHINHSSVTITAGIGLTGGGDITASRTINLDIPELPALTDAGVLASTDTFAVYNTSATAHEEATMAQLQTYMQNNLTFGAGDTFAIIQVDGVTQSTNAPTLDFDSSDFTLVESPTDDFDITINNSGIDHDQTTNFVANEHIDHSGVTITAGIGLTGGGDITASRTIDLNIPELPALTDGGVLVGTDTFAVYNISAAAHEEATVTELQTYMQNNLTVNASNIELAKIGNPSNATVQVMQDIFHSAGLGTGGEISVSATPDSVDVTAGEGWIRAVNDHETTLYAFGWSGATLSIPDNTIRYIGCEYNAGSPQLVARLTNTFNGQDDFLIGSVINDGTTIHIASAGARVGDHAGQMILRNLQTQPIARDRVAGGLAIDETGTRNVDMSAGAVWAGLNRFPQPAIDTSASGSFTAWYYNGSAWVNSTGVIQWPNTNYNDITTGLVAMNNNYYASLWFYIDLENHLHMVYGQNQFSGLAAVETEAPPITVPPVVIQHSLLLARFIFKKNDSVTTSIIDYRGTVPTGGAGLADHGSLTGLTDDDHLQYHTDARALTWLGTRSTTDLPEGTNLYYTDERAQDSVGTILTDSATIDFTYNDGAPSITAAVVNNTTTQKVEVVKNSGAVVGTRKQLNFIEGTNVTLTIADDAGNDQVDITIASTGASGTANDAVQARRTTTFTLSTAFEDITFNTTDVETNAAVIEHNNTNTDDIDIKVAGTYEVSYYAPIDTSGLSNGDTWDVTGRIRLNDTGTDLNGSASFVTAWQDSSIVGTNFGWFVANTVFATLAVNDKLTLQVGATDNAGSGGTIGLLAGTTLKVKRLT